MTGRPPAFADRPFPPAADRGASPHAMSGPDVLSDVLRVVRLTGATFLTGRFTAPFGFVSPKRYDAAMPMAKLRHISIFHLVVAGECMIETASGERRRAVVGDLILLPFADQHRMWNGEVGEFISALSVLRRGPVDGIWTMEHGHGGAETRIVCGFIESSEFLFTPVFRTLPEIVVEPTGEQRTGVLITQTVQELMALVEAGTPGAQTMLDRMMEILFVEVLRRHAGRLAAESGGWLGALGDPIVGRALQLFHGAPGRKWSVADLAREAGTSRTVLVERFNALLGRPPMEYVTCWRVQLAADRLRNGRDAIAIIAADIGYESEAAFSRAFKRVTGISPGRWRAGAGDSPPLMPLQLKTPVIPDPAQRAARDRGGD